MDNLPLSDPEKAKVFAHSFINSSFFEALYDKYRSQGKDWKYFVVMVLHTICKQFPRDEICGKLSWKDIYDGMENINKEEAKEFLESFDNFQQTSGGFNM